MLFFHKICNDRNKYDIIVSAPAAYSEKEHTVMSSKELLGVLCLLEAIEDECKAIVLKYLRCLRESGDTRALVASLHQTGRKEEK